MNYKDIHFVIVGPGHSGSTWLAANLRKHPEIFCTYELSYLTWTKARGLDFASVFPPIGKRPKILGEHSNDYIHHEFVPRHIWEENPGIKIILVMRDPVERALSNFRHDRRYGTIGRQVRMEIAVLKTMLWYRYVYEGMYETHIRRYFDVFGARNIYLFSAYHGDIEESYNDIIKFLGASPLIPDDLRAKVNVNGQPLLPYLHWIATFGEGRISRSAVRLSRWLDPINLTLGNKYCRYTPSPADMRALRDAFGEHDTLKPSVELALAEGIAMSPGLRAAFQSVDAERGVNADSGGCRPPIPK